MIFIDHRHHRHNQYDHIDSARIVQIGVSVHHWRPPISCWEFSPNTTNHHYQQPTPTPSVMVHHYRHHDQGKCVNGVSNRAWVVISCWELQRSFVTFPHFLKILQFWISNFREDFIFGILSTFILLLSAWWQFSIFLPISNVLPNQIML